MLQDEYYVMGRENNDNHPLFSWDQNSGKFGLGKPIETQEPVKLRLGEPISPNFQWVDFHKLPDPVFSKRIMDVLAPMHLYGTQLIPAKVRNPNGGPFDEPRDYWFMHVWNRIACLDKERSKIRTNSRGNRIFAIDKLFLNEKTLEHVELKQRLVFELAEKLSVLLVHESVKDAILSVNPVGCRFFKASEWNTAIVFN
ncbi:MAG: DUF1629 domain-containing protein [Pseudomonadota bacterium]